MHEIDEIDNHLDDCHDNNLAPIRTLPLDCLSNIVSQTEYPSINLLCFTCSYFYENRSKIPLLLNDRVLVADKLLDVIHWLKYPFDLYCFKLAITHNHLEIMEIMGKQDNFESWKTDKDCTFTAIVKGHLEALKWLHAEGFAMDDTGAQTAIQHGFCDIIEWMDISGVISSIERMDDMGVTSLTSMDEDIKYLFLEIAAENGQDSILRLLHSKGFNLDGIHEYDVGWQHISVLEVYNELYPYSNFYSIWIHAVIKYNIPVLEWLLLNKPTPKQARSSITLCEVAANQDNYLALKWLREHEFQWSRRRCLDASINNKEVHDWVINN
jgi:hypothetical protein